MRKIYITAVVAIILTLVGCKTYKVIETRYVEDTAWVRDTFYKALHRYTEQNRQVYDSMAINYKVGSIDTVSLVRVDTVISYHLKYIGDKELSHDRDTTAAVNASGQSIATKETATVEPVIKKPFPWWRVAGLIGWVMAVALMLYIVKRLLSK